MNKKEASIKNRIQILIILLVWGILALLCWFLPRQELSEGERRKLAQFPTISWSSIMKGSYAEKFEEAATDQFPMRETVRSIRAVTDIYGFRKKDVHGIYLAEGYLAESLYPLRESSVHNAGEKCESIYQEWLAGTDTSVYAAIIPDKGYYLSEENGYLTPDYEQMKTIMEEEFPEAEWIPIEDTLSIEDYYATDSHWRQEQLEETANRLLDAMGGEALQGLEQKQALEEFHGVYEGQSALPVRGEPMYYLTNDVLEQCQVHHVENGKTLGIYEEEKLTGRDPYEFFLSGSTAIAMIENPQCTTGRELVVFRDSFGSSMVPLLVQSYSRVTVIDTRYVNPELIGDYVELENQDVLFLYSTLLLNNSETMR
ncbi:MAG: hypothetical protein J6K43_16370 [Lachnospiraceae bacterium]|nr:hypothetical protein [Lachnospiraceae bacterium]